MRRRTAVSSSPRSRAAVAALAIVMLGASACGQADSSAQPSTASSVAADYESPIASFLGVDFDGADQQEAYLATERARIEWITTCMAQEGFEYRATDPAVWAEMGAVDPDGPEWGSVEWVAIYGFGISTQMFDQETVGPDLVGNPAHNYNTNVEDPNRDYVSALSNEEQSAYYAALYGDNGYEWDETMSEEENQAAADIYFESVVETGCEPRSYESASPTDPYQLLYDAFGDELNAMYERVHSDPEIVKAAADVSRCASEAGYDFTDEQTMYDDMYQRLDPVQSSMVWPTDGMDEDAWSELSDEARDELENQQPKLSADGKAILAEVQQFEIEMATAVFNCGFRDLQNLYPQVLMRYEQQFVDSHSADLEAMRTSQ